jgi:small subunit ribosomal protein S3
MGQKINPKSYRLGVVKDWPVRWFFPSLGKDAGKAKRFNYAKFLEEDEFIRKIIRQRISTAGIAGVEIERTASNLRIVVKAARPGLVIGRGGKGIEELSAAIEKGLRALQGKNVSGKINLSLNVEELKRTEISAVHVGQQIAWDLERRMPFRRTMKKYLDQVMQNREARGVKVLLSGRLGGAEIARREVLKSGALPLQTLRADIDYGKATAFTAYGTIGIKVWIYKGEVFSRRKANENNSK